MSLTTQIQEVDRRIKATLRGVNPDTLEREDLAVTKRLKLLCNEARLDIRDYEYAETRTAQQQVRVNARKNLLALEKCVVQLSGVFGPADVAELSARLEQIREKLT